MSIQIIHRLNIVHRLATVRGWRVVTALLAVVLSLGALRPAAAGPGARHEAPILEHIAALQSSYEAREEPDAAAAAAYLEELQTVAEIARIRACPRAESEALLLVGELQRRATREEEAVRSFKRAVKSAGRCGDWELERRALQSALWVQIRSESKAIRRGIRTTLAAYVDVSATNDRLQSAMNWISYASNKSSIPLTRNERGIFGLTVIGLEFVAHATIMGQTDALAATITGFHNAGLPLLAGSVAEQIEHVKSLERALLVHQSRGDAVAELRVGALLLRLQPERAKLKDSMFDTAVRAGRYDVAAVRAPNADLAAQYKRLHEQETAEADKTTVALTAWQRDGRWPDKPDLFYDALVEGLAPTAPNDLKMDLLDFAHLDGSRAYVPLFFEVLDSPLFGLGRRAAEAISELATPEDEPALIAALDNENWEIRRHIAMTLSRMATESPTIVDAIEARLSVEEDESVRAALRWGLVRAGRPKPHLMDLRKQLRGKDPRAAATASVVLFDLGFKSVVDLIEKNSRKDAEGDAAADTALLLGSVTNPEAVHYLERYARNKTYPMTTYAARGLNRFDTPRAQAFRKSQLSPKPQGASSSYPWWGLRDIRRGRWTPEESSGLVNAEITARLDRYALASDMLEWMTDEQSGEVEIQLDVMNDKWTADTRNALRKLNGRKTGDLWSGGGGSGKKSFKIAYKGRLNAAVLHVELAPKALLLDPTTLVIDLHKEQHHSGMSHDLLGKLWLNFDLVLEADESLKSAVLEGVPGVAEPLAAGQPGSPSFVIPESVTPGQLQQAELVLSFGFFGGERKLRFPLAAILKVTDGVKADLAVTHLNIDPPTPRPGEHSVILLDVENAGDLTAPATEAVVYAVNRLHEEKRRELGRIQIPTMQPGDRVELALGAEVAADFYLAGYTPGWTPDDQDTAIEVILDPDNTIDETDESNNRRVRPVAFVLTDEERAGRTQDEVLAKLDELAKEMDGFGPESDSDAVRKTLKDMIAELDAVRPPSPGLRRLRRQLQMLGGQLEARDRLVKTIPEVLAFDPNTGSGEDAARLLGDLLRSQADLLRSGIPMTAEQIARMQNNVDTFREAFGDEIDLLDADQSDALERAAGALRRGEVMRKIPGLTGPSPAAQPAGDAYLRQNMEWNNDGFALTSQAFEQAIGNEERWFKPDDMKDIQRQWNAWSGPQEASPEASEIPDRAQEDSATAEPASRTARTMLKRLGF